MKSKLSQEDLSIISYMNKGEDILDFDKIIGLLKNIKEGNFTQLSSGEMLLDNLHEGKVALPMFLSIGLGMFIENKDLSNRILSYVEDESKGYSSAYARAVAKSNSDMPFAMSVLSKEKSVKIPDDVGGILLPKFDLVLLK